MEAIWIISSRLSCLFFFKANKNKTLPKYFSQRREKRERRERRQKGKKEEEGERDKRKERGEKRRRVREGRYERGRGEIEYIHG